MTTKPSNPKDIVGSKKWRWMSVIPATVLWELGLALLEGSLKYGRHNYRSVGIRASVYYDACVAGHLMPWWEGEDLDPDSGLSHITKAIAGLVVLRDSMIRGNWQDDRPPKADVERLRTEAQAHVDRLLAQYPDPKPATTALPVNGGAQPKVYMSLVSHCPHGYMDHDQCPDCCH